VGVLVFLIPALAEDQREPKASPPVAGFAPGDLTDEAPDAGFDWVEGTWTEVK
jgi:hypothetical protein